MIFFSAASFSSDVAFASFASTIAFLRMLESYTRKSKIFLPSGGVDAGARLVHHPLDVAFPLGREGVVGVDGPAQLVALRAFRGEDLVVLLDPRRIFRHVDGGRTFLETFDARLGFRVELIVGSGGGA